MKTILFGVIFSTVCSSSFMIEVVHRPTNNNPHHDYDFKKIPMQPFSSTWIPNKEYDSHVTHQYHQKQRSITMMNMARYGPREDLPQNMEDNFFQNQDEWEKKEEERIQRQKIEFLNLLEDILNTTDPNELPSIMSQRMDLMLSLRGYEGVRWMKEFIQQANATSNEEYMNQVTAACDYILDFTEEFVEQAKAMDDANKALLGKIVRQMTGISNFSNDSEKEELSDIEREKKLDEFLEKERDNFTPGFLRHVEGECNRIETAPKMSRESSKMLQTLRMIQTRVVEELGKDLGEGAQILGQLLGYDDRNERIAVLEAGLTVRGIDFAKEMSALTEEALEGFNAIPKGKVDPELIRRVEDIHANTLTFIESRSSWE